MTESREHKLCKDNLASLVEGKTEVRIQGGKRRADVVDSSGNVFEVECNRDSKGNMKCDVVTPKKQKIDCDCINNLADGLFD